MATTTEPTKKTKRTLAQRIDATRAEYADKIVKLRNEEAIAIGKLKMNAKGEELAAAGIDVSKDADCAAFFKSKSTPAPNGSGGEGKKAGEK